MSLFLLFQDSGAANPAITDVSWLDLSLALGLVLIAVGISRRQKLGLVKDLIIGAIRTIVQLVLVGYVLVCIFALDRLYITLAVLALMLIVATGAAIGRQNKSRRELKWITGAAMLLGSSFTLLFITTLVVRVHLWHDPRYLIPLFGMIVGSAMNGAAIAIERLNGEMEARTGEIEAYLALGATYRQASEQPLR